MLATQVMHINNFEEMKCKLVTLMEHPVIKSSLMSKESKEKGIAPFNMAQNTQWTPENREVAFPGQQHAVPPLIGKLHDCVQDLSYSL